MIEAIAQRLAVNIKTVVPNHPASVNVLRFALAAVLNGVFIVSFSLIISILFHATPEALVVLISFAVLRQMSGGIHLKNGMACIIVSTIGVTVLSLIQLSDSIILGLNLMNTLLALFFAPSRIEKQTRIKPKYFPLLKISSTLLVASNFLFGSSVLAATFFVQCLTLIRRPMRERGGIAND